MTKNRCRDKLPQKNYIDEAIFQNLRKKDVYKSDMHKIYNIIVVQMNEQLQEKAESDATLQSIKTDLEPIVYMMILKRLCLSNQSEHHPTAHCAWLQGVCMTPCSTPKITPPTTFSGSVMPRRSMKPVTEA